MKLFILLSVFVFQVSALAAQRECYLNEMNPQTGEAFATTQIYAKMKSEWKKLSPGLSQPFLLVRAYAVYKQEKDKAESLGTDKLAHCYMGCRIAQETDYSTAAYVGWLKEDRDISDCKAFSHFDEEDYIATIRGAEFGVVPVDTPSCAAMCKQIYR